MSQNETDQCHHNRNLEVDENEERENEIEPVMKVIHDDGGVDGPQPSLKTTGYLQCSHHDQI